MWGDPDARFFTYIARFAAFFGWDPRTVETFTLDEFDLLVEQLEVLEAEAQKPR